ncbi:MAG: TetR/AcrR family transcriptional regulator, partial [Mycobacterium sp.]|nr:TetR/AcrR family transcriptional regulator [Mycobacterium sp.]
MSAQKPDPTGAKILDGAIRVLADFGVKRATVELVAKYAGVSHMTIYRRWPSKSDLFTAAVLGEFTALLDAAFDSAANSDESFADRTLKAFTEIVWEVQHHPVVLRELSSESGEQVLMLSGAVMETSVPMVIERLRRLAVAGAPADLDAVADVFVRLAHSLVVVKRPGQSPADREESTGYARECFGPYLKALAGPAASGAGAAPVIDLDQRRPSRQSAGRPRMHIAVASVLAVLGLSVGLTVALSGNNRLPFITPADNPRSSEPAAPAAVPGAPARGGSPVTAEPLPPALPPEDTAAGSRVTAIPAAPPQTPQVPPPAAAAQTGAGRQPTAVVGS